MLGYLDYAGPSEVSGVLKPISCQKMLSLRSSQGTACVSDPKRSRDRPNCEWGDKLAIMDMENNVLMVIWRKNTGLARRRAVGIPAVTRPLSNTGMPGHVPLPGGLNTTRGKNCAWDYPRLNVMWALSFPCLLGGCQ